MFLVTGGAGTILHDVRFVEGVMRVAGLTFLVDGREGDAVSETFLDNLAKLFRRERATCHQRFVMTRRAIIAERRVFGRNGSGAKESFGAALAVQPNSDQAPDDRDEGGPAAGASPGVDLFIITEVTFVAFGDLLLRSARCGHGARSIIKERHERVPRREHQQEKRNRDMDEEPAVQPMLHFGLQIEHAPLVAPRLNFIHAHAIGLRDS